MTEESTFDWGEKGEAYWRDLGAQCKASEQQIRFACARHGGASATGAARLAGYDPGNDPATIRQAGYKAIRTTAVAAMLAIANSEDEPSSSPTKVMDKAARLAKLSAIAHKSQDPTLQIRSIEAMNKMQETADEANQSHDTDGFKQWRAARDMLQQAGGAVALLSTFCAADGACPSHLPLLHDVHKAMMRDDPEYWAKTVARYSVHERVWLQKLLDNPKHQIEARIKLWREVGIDLDPDRVVDLSFADGEGSNRV